MNTDEANLIAAARQGSVPSFNRLVRIYQGLVYHTTYHVLGDSNLASTATQDTFQEAYQQLSNFQGGNFQVWLLRITINHCYGQKRRRRRNRSKEARAAEAPTPLPTNDLSELGTIVQQGLQALPPPERTTCVLSDLVGLDQAQVAQITSSNPETVNVRLSRARRRLRDVLCTPR